jgi:transposase
LADETERELAVILAPLASATAKWIKSCDGLMLHPITSQISKAPPSLNEAALICTLMPGNPRRNLTHDERVAVIVVMLEHFQNGKLPHGTIKNVANQFGCHRHTIMNLWKRYTGPSSLNADVQSRMKAKTGRKGYDYEVLAQRMRCVPLRRRMKIRSLAKQLNVSVSVIQRLLKMGKIKRHTNNLKSVLTASNKLERVRFAASHVDYDGDKAMFQPMYNVVHVDEKWFNEDTDKRVFYILDDEEPPQRKRKSKRFIGKTMFIVAVARPRYLPPEFNTFVN